MSEFLRAKIIFVQQRNLLTSINNRISGSIKTNTKSVTFSDDYLGADTQNSPMKNSPPHYLVQEAKDQKSKDIEWANFVLEKLNPEQLIAYCKEHGFETDGKTESEIRLALLQSRY
jgi:hypothetical protein